MKKSRRNRAVKKSVRVRDSLHWLEGGRSRQQGRRKSSCGLRLRNHTHAGTGQKRGKQPAPSRKPCPRLPPTCADHGTYANFTYLDRSQCWAVSPFAFGFLWRVAFVHVAFSRLFLFYRIRRARNGVPLARGIAMTFKSKKKNLSRPVHTDLVGQNESEEAKIRNAECEMGRVGF